MKTNKTLYGLLAFGPFALMIIAFIGFFTMLYIPSRTYGDDPEILMLALFGVAMVIGAILSIVSLILFIIHIGKNPRVPEDQRIAWILGMVLVGNIASIVYFFVYIIKEEDYVPPAEQMKQNSWD